ncbi:hypothetical protein [Streptomyces sp. NBC_01235]|uniref:hypothetical protein n=1 Tax=Streptomyces sp. NBC_01235 TaxID=2903788 RepID=UPI002E1177FF|nr:hypothetical protein OG289_02610 [Streptomyces sp. NBC_01235]
MRLFAELAVRELRPLRVVLRIERGNAASEAVARAWGFTLTEGAPAPRQAKGREDLLRAWFLREDSGGRG